MNKKHRLLKFFVSLLILCCLVGGGYYVYEKTDLIVPNFTVEFVCEDGETDAKNVVIRKNKKLSELPTATKEGYEFDGWYDGETKFDEDSLVTKNLKLVAKFIPKKIDITFVVDGTSYTEKEDYDSLPVFDGDLTKTPTETIAYEFVGWQPALEIVKTPKTYTAKFEAVTRKYKVLAEANYPRACTIVGAGTDFEYKNSTTISVTNIETGYDFLGWFKEDGTFVSNNLSLSISSIEEDIKYIAKFKQNFYTAKFVVDDNEIESLWKQLEYEDALLEPVVDLDALRMSGYSIDGWYTDSDCTNKFVFGNTLSSDIVLYGKYKYFLANGFYDYKAKFDAAKSSDTISINSFDELVCYIEYVLFYSKNNGCNVKLTYANFYTTQNLFNEFNRACEYSAMPTYPLRYSAYRGQVSIGRIYVESGAKSSEATLVADSTKSQTLPQLDSAFLAKKASGRTEDYVFPVEKVGASLVVSDSSGLVYCLEKGLKPVPVAGSKAEIVYNKAKAILREICDDSMTNTEKARAIYEWLIMNVQYDNYAADSISSGWYNYDSWFAEGVFNNGVAVCDGIAKAYLILAQIENIPTIRVDGNAHAWNKIYVENNWFGVDATHGNVLVNNSYEVASYTSFLFTDDYKENAGYSTSDYPEIKAETEYNVYDSFDYSYNGSSFDLLVNSQSELVLIFRYAKTVTFDTSYLTLEIAFDKSISSSDANTMIQQAMYVTRLNIELASLGTTDSLGQYVVSLYVA